MANPLRGQSELAANGHVYKLALNFNALVEAEAASGLLLPELLRQLQGGGGVALRATLWAALQEYQDVTLVEVSEIIATAGVKQSLAALEKAVEGAFLPSEKDKTANPRKAAAGTGKAG